MTLLCEVVVVTPPGVAHKLNVHLVASSRQVATAVARSPAVASGRQDLRSSAGNQWSPVVARSPVARSPDGVARRSPV
eukprot:6122704-Prymnesium_polylepis.2